MIILALGSNLSSKYGDRYNNIELAISQLESYGIQIVKKSSFYESPSYPDKKNPKFINMIIAASTDLPPVDFASVLIFIEEKLERKRNKKNDPRTCDIDIIDFNGQILDFIYNEHKFNVPHEKIEYRNFVLFPLKEILPDWKHPVSKKPVSILIEKLPEEDKNSILKIKKS